IGSAGTWRPAPPGRAGARTYATTVAFRLGADPAGVAATLADSLRERDWVEATSVTGGGYLTVTITADALAPLPLPITRRRPARGRAPRAPAARGPPPPPRLPGDRPGLAGGTPAARRLHPRPARRGGWCLRSLDRRTCTTASARQPTAPRRIRHRGRCHR